MKLTKWRLAAAAACVGVTVAVTAGASQPETNRFKGGFYDGWDMSASVSAVQLNGPVVTLSSGQDQVLQSQVYRASAATLTLTDVAGGAVQIGNNLTLAFGSPLNLKWDISELGAYGGTAAGKVGPAGLDNDDTHLVIPVYTTFSAGDSLTLSGLQFAGVPFCPQYTPGRIILDFDDDGLWDSADTHTLTSRMSWSGGIEDGWDSAVNPEYQSVAIKGTLFMMR